MRTYDLVVVGGGHAGLEAAMAAARLGARVALVTSDPAAIGRMSCNPAIGGTAKGHLVREIDALGGVMGRLADATGIQFRTLNLSKGPAIWSTRCQSDRARYNEAAVALVSAQPGLEVVTGTALDVVVEDGRVNGLVTDREELPCRALVVCAGTFLNGVLWTGTESRPGGRHDEAPARGLTEALVRLGFETGRLKTGTPPRILAASIAYDRLDAQHGDPATRPFSQATDPARFPVLPQVPCHLTWTNARTHEALRAGFDRSPLFTGLISGLGPRYCPSIEDKVSRFAERERHHLFLEPEGLDDPLVYVNGFPTSLPAEVQLAALRTVPGLEDCEMARPGYAVEYDFFPAWQLSSTLESKLVRGLYLAGQVNGTSGYEEAAAQGLVAGINAAHALAGKTELVLGRGEAYAGVLVDDLVTRAPLEPYRMFTSRAEHRLLLREDNADRRLLAKGRELGLVEDGVFAAFLAREARIEAGLVSLRGRTVTPARANERLHELGMDRIAEPTTLAQLFRRQDADPVRIVAELVDDPDPDLAALVADPDAFRKAAVELKYEGYLARERALVARLARDEARRVPADFAFETVTALSHEGREKLARFRPRTLGQASRIAGVTPADLAVLLVSLRRRT